MIPRYQTILIVVLLVASILMGGFLWQMLDRAHKRMLAGEDASPTQAPLVTPAEQATLYVASDADNTLAPQALVLPLPASQGPRAKAIVGKLLDLYAAPGAPHPVPGGAAAVAQVFLLPKPADRAAKNAEGATTTAAISAPVANTTAANASSGTGPQLAVVNLTSAFANAHPSGLETETLTVLSICATLHANLPMIAEVRFLVDGAPRATLAGHADLTRTYIAADAATPEGTHP
ncbi:MAG: GerMN domain-containing protein [Terracidiphilus sp.]|nr:GerMN domain-containing protein [Terracidiphilus sp.]